MLEDRSFSKPLSVATAILLMGYGGRLGTGEFSPPQGTESGRVEELLDKELPEDPPSFTLILSSEEMEAADPTFRHEVERALEPLEEDERVTGIQTAYENGPPNEAMISRDGHRALVVVELEEGDLAELQDAYAAPRPDSRRGEEHT